MSTLYLILFIFGLFMGSFFNVVALRYDPKKSLFRIDHLLGRSKCPHCKKTLHFYELIPLVSFFIQSGKCGKCKKRLSLQYPLVEIITGIVTAGVPFVLGNIFFIKQIFLTGSPIGWFIAFSVLWIWVFYFFIVLALIDLKHQIIPNELNALLAVFGVLITFWYFWYDKFGLVSGTFVGGYASMLGFRESIWTNHFLAAGVVLGLFLLVVVLSRGKGMGMGDVKLVAALGFLFGWPDVLLIVFLAFVLGSIVGIYLIVKNRKNIATMVPFGPFLVLASTLVFFFGESMLKFYFNLFGIL